MKQRCRTAWWGCWCTGDWLAHGWELKNKNFEIFFSTEGPPHLEAFAWPGLPIAVGRSNPGHQHQYWHNVNIMFKTNIIIYVNTNISTSTNIETPIIWGSRSRWTPNWYQISAKLIKWYQISPKGIKEYQISPGHVLPARHQPLQGHLACIALGSNLLHLRVNQRWLSGKRNKLLLWKHRLET